MRWKSKKKEDVLEEIRKKLVNTSLEADVKQYRKNMLYVRADELNKKYEKRKSDGAKKKELDEILKERDEALALADGGWGDVIALGLVGKDNSGMLKDIHIGNDWSKGIEMGTLLKFTLSVEKAIGVNIDRYVKGLFDMTLGKVEEFIIFLKRLIFNSNCEPFTVAQIKSWRNLISSDFRELDMMIKNSGKYGSSGRDDILREYETDQNRQEQQLNLWLDFVQDQVLTYAELAEEIEKRLGFYGEKEIGFGVINCAQRLKNKLLKVKSWLLSVKSLKDFANISEIKSIIPAMKRSLENYFDALSNQIGPVNGKENRFGKKNSWGNSGFDDHDSLTKAF